MAAILSRGRRMNAGDIDITANYIGRQTIGLGIKLSFVNLHSSSWGNAYWISLFDSLTMEMNIYLTRKRRWIIVWI